MSKIGSCSSPVEVVGSAVALVRWCSGKERRAVWQLHRRKFQRRTRANANVQSVRLGNRRCQKLTFRRLVRWPVVRWRAAVGDLVGPIKKALLEIASAQRQQQLLLHNFTLVNHFPFPLV